MSIITKDCELLRIQDQPIEQGRKKHEHITLHEIVRYILEVGTACSENTEKGM